MCMDRDDEQIAHRLKRARARRFKTAGKAIEELEARWGIKRRTYFSHEAGERTPSDRDIERYAELFGVTPQYLRYGDGSEVFDSAEEIVNEDEDKGLPRLINQGVEQFKLNPSHNHPVRFIVILSANEIRKISTGQGDLAKMSGRSLPVPDFLSASRHSFAYIIPQNDMAMMTDRGQSFGPGTCLIIDQEREIAPGDFVLVEHADFAAPLFRTFRAVAPYKPGMTFELSAFNPAYQNILVDAAAKVISIGRVIWAQLQL